MFLISDETKCAVSDDPWEAGLFRSRPSPEASKTKGNEQKSPESSKAYLARARPCSRSRRGRTHRCSRRGIGAWHMMLLCVAMGPVRAGVHLVRRGRMALILSHLVSLRLVGGVGRRVCGAVRRERGIYHGVRLDIGR